MIQIIVSKSQALPIQNLNKLFGSPFYIDGKYAESFIPLFVGVLQGKVNISAAEKATVNVSTAKMQEPDGTGTDGRSVAVVSIKSPVIKFSTYTIAGTRLIWDQINRLDKDPNIAGIVLDIDSGGGQVYGTPEFFDNLKNIETPLVAYTDGLMCSAAYYIAAASDYIIANKRADAIGSIGAYAQFFDFSGFWEKHGAKLHTLYADQSTEKNKPYRDVLDGNYKTYISESLNPTVETFIADMKSARPNLSEEVFKGGTWTGTEALKRNLVDAVGNLQDAIAKAFELHTQKTKTTNTTTMSKPKSFPNLEAALNLSEPLATTEDKGSYLQEEQKQAIDDQLSKAAQDVQAANKEKETAQTELATEKENTVAAVASLRAAATLAGVEGLADDATPAQISTALTAKIEELNGKPGATHTGVGASEEEEDTTPSYVNKEAYKKMLRN